MRITSFTIFNQLTRSLQENLRKMGIYSDRLSSGKRINKPSDDISGMSRVMDYRVSINEIEQYKKNIDDALGHLQQTDTIMSSVYTQISEAKAVAVQAATGTMTPEDRAAIAKNTANIRDEVMRLSQTTFGDRYIFSGYKTDTVPFDEDFVYQGNSGEISILIDRNSTMAVNVPGDEAFSVGGVTFMETLDDLTTALEDPDSTSEIISAFITSLDSDISQIANVRIDAGSKMKRLEDLQSSFEDRSLTFNTLMSNAQDTDIADTVSELAKIQVSLESLRASGSKVISQSLLDFLR